jgi:hypothetical protein
MQTKRIPSTPEELEGSAAKFFVSVREASDRGCLLVTPAFLDEGLEAALRSRMSGRFGPPRRHNPVRIAAMPTFSGWLTKAG